MNEIIEIPFSESMRHASLNGRKVCTSRNKKYGTFNDIFYIDGVLFRLLDVMEESLGTVAERYYRLEGFDSSDGFINIWNELHPKRGFIPTDKVYVHFFAKV